MGSELNRLTITEARERLRRREITSRELTRDCLERIAAVEPRLNAFITVCEDEAMAQADDADRRLRSPPMNVSRRSGPTPAARFAYQPRSAAWSGSNPPIAV